jgi:hypothetical protein
MATQLSRRDISRALSAVANDPAISKEQLYSLAEAFPELEEGALSPRNFDLRALAAGRHRKLVAAALREGLATSADLRALARRLHDEGRWEDMWWLAEHFRGGREGALRSLRDDLVERVVRWDQVPEVVRVLGACTHLLEQILETALREELYSASPLRDARSFAALTAATAAQFPLFARFARETRALEPPAGALPAKRAPALERAEVLLRGVAALARRLRGTAAGRQFLEETRREVNRRCAEALRKLQSRDIHPVKQRRTLPLSGPGEASRRTTRQEEFGERTAAVICDNAKQQLALLNL